MTQRTRTLLGVLLVLFIANLGNAIAFLQQRPGGTVVGGMVGSGSSPNVAAALNVDADGNLSTAPLAGTTVNVNIGSVAGSTAIGVSGALATVSQNTTGTTGVIGGVGLNQYGGVAVPTGTSGVVVATLTNTSGTIGALNANQSVNLAQVAGATPLAAGSGAVAVTGTTSSGASTVGGPVFIGGATGGTTYGLATDTSGRPYVATVDPCGPTSPYPKGHTAISLTTSSQVITGTTGNFIYICAIDVVVAAATNVAVVAGTGTVCATSIGGLYGGTTAATGWNFAANGGISKGAGSGTVGKNDATGENLCILVSAANQTSGSITYVLSP